MSKYEKKVKIDKKLDFNEALRKIVSAPPVKKDDKKPKNKGKK